MNPIRDIQRKFLKDFPEFPTELIQLLFGEAMERFTLRKEINSGNLILTQRHMFQRETIQNL